MMGKPSAQKMHDIQNSAHTEESGLESESESESSPPLDLVEVPQTSTKRKRVKTAHTTGTGSKSVDIKRKRQKPAIDLNEEDVEKVYDVPKVENTLISHKHTIGKIIVLFY